MAGHVVIAYLRHTGIGNKSYNLIVAFIYCKGIGAVRVLDILIFHHLTQHKGVDASTEFILLEGGQEMRKSTLKVLISMMIGGLMVVVTGQISSAQEFRKGLVRGIFESIMRDLPKGMVKSTVTELAKGEEFRKQTIRQLVREVTDVIGPENMKDIVKSAAAEMVDAYGLKTRMDRGVTADLDLDSLRVPSSSVAGELIKNPEEMNALKSRGPVSNPQALTGILRERTIGSDGFRMLSNPERTSASKGLRKDTMALIAHSSNVVHTLTVDQVRKLFSGEYTNWSQVGGGDLPVNLITTRDVAARLESLLDTHIAPSAARVPFLSFLYVGVAETEGAVGFITTHNMDRLETVNGHDAIKKIAIKKDNHAPDGLLISEP